MKITNDIAIQLIGISKRYTIHHEKPTLVERLEQNIAPYVGIDID